MRCFSNENNAVSERIRSVLGSVECYVILFIGVWIFFSFYI